MEKLFKNLTTISVVALLATPGFASAVSMVDYSGQSLKGIIDNVSDFLLGFAAAIALLFIIFSGLKMITANGNKERYESAKKTLTYAVVGLVVVILSLFIIEILINIPTGIGITN